jgi:hypothetical protein
VFRDEYLKIGEGWNYYLGWKTSGSFRMSVCSIAEEGEREEETWEALYQDRTECEKECFL